MAIKQLQEGGTMFTGDHTQVFRWISVKYALGLEKAGMKGRGGALRPRLAKELGLSPRASYDEFAKAVQAKIDGTHAIANAKEGSKQC